MIGRKGFIKLIKKIAYYIYSNPINSVTISIVLEFAEITKMLYELYGISQEEVRIIES